MSFEELKPTQCYITYIPGVILAITQHRQRDNLCEKENYSWGILPGHLSCFQSKENRIHFHYKIELTMGLTGKSLSATEHVLSLCGVTLGQNLTMVSFLTSRNFSPPNILRASRMKCGLTMKI